MTVNPTGLNLVQYYYVSCVSEAKIAVECAHLTDLRLKMEMKGFLC